MFEVFENTKKSLYPIIGRPIEQVKSPVFFNRYFSDFGIDAEMIAIDVAPSDLGIFFDRLRAAKKVRGCVVTVPHKTASIQYVDQLSNRAEFLGALNVIGVEDGRLSGDMVDGLGFLAAVGTHEFTCKNKRIGIVGLGAAGSAIAYAAASSGAERILIQDLDMARCSLVKKKLMGVFPNVEWSIGIEAPEEIDLIVNASPAGMNGDAQLPMSLDSVEPSCLIMDIVTNPVPTPWLKSALERGCEVVYGSEMIQGQFSHMGRFMGLDIQAIS